MIILTILKGMGLLFTGMVSVTGILQTIDNTRELITKKTITFHNDEDPHCEILELGKDKKRIITFLIQHFIATLGFTIAFLWLCYV